jgi:hypothetical protein
MVGSRPYPQALGLGRMACKGKLYSLFGGFESDEEKKFYDIETWSSHPTKTWIPSLK